MAAARTGTARQTRIKKALKAALRPELATGSDKSVKIRVCAGSTCNATGRAAVSDALAKELDKRSLSDTVEVVLTGCHGLCQEGPIAVVHPKGVFYPRLKARDMAEIVETSVVGDDVVERLLYRDPATGEAIALEKDVPFYAGQTRVVRKLNGTIDPTSIDDYLSRGGYAALAKVLGEDAPEAVIDLVEAAGLRGRGGAGFPTGTKWRYCRANPGEKHYIIANGDEGDPGAFMDRAILEDNPHSLVEGMLIGAFAIGADEGYVYVRHEYPLAVSRLRHALEQARERGLLGEDILGTGWKFDLKINQGAGAFVCGESTALTASIEGHRGMPRGKHIRTVAHGLWQQPTDLNNVETFANVPWIVTNGADAFRALGTEGSKGTKIFSLAGKARNSGLVEVPMGATLREVIFDVGGGMQEGREFKAVQLGGPSGGCLPAELLDTPIDFENLTRYGSMMGSGGMVVVDDTTCMVDFAKFFFEFTAQESCGKCVPCRIGTQRVLEILERIAAGEGTEHDVELLEQLSDDIIEGSLCQLGGSAPNPVLTTLRYFRDEVMAHVVEKRCPAKVCRPLIKYTIDPDACNGCHACFGACPTNAISGERKQLHTIDQKLCIKCDTCRQVCKFDAVPVVDAQPALVEGRAQ
ncbi:MAG TPA: NADH-ubiquinone oxidoreductase-F iron-sulfur binding region domain-containing protein [Thermoleophilia bacterium]|nr:NADH-ubiquinone oxidoreductase-F iron-sulfur binding region domain-containing protein [Thermoleophilia bacterium]